MRITLKKDAGRYTVIWAISPRNNGGRSFETLEAAKAFAVEKMGEST